MPNQDIALRPAGQPLESPEERPNRARALDMMLNRAHELPANGTAIAVAAAVAGSIDRIMEKAVPYGATIEAEIDLSHVASDGAKTAVTVKLRSSGRRA